MKAEFLTAKNLGLFLTANNLPALGQVREGARKTWWGRGVKGEKRVNFLVNTSVEDLQSSLPYYKADEPEDVEVIRQGFEKCARRGEKTKANILYRKLKKMEKERDA